MPSEIYLWIFQEVIRLRERHFESGRVRQGTHSSCITPLALKANLTRLPSPAYLCARRPPSRKERKTLCVGFILLLSPFSSACLWKEIGASRPMGPEAEDKVRSCTQKQIA